MTNLTLNDKWKEKYEDNESNGYQVSYKIVKPILRFLKTLDLNRNIQFTFLLRIL